MKIHGKKIEGPKAFPIVFQRGDDEIVFMIKPLISYDEFDAKCPEPEPTRVTKPGGISYLDTTNAHYLDALEKLQKLRWSWMIIHCLRATEGLEWEKVDVNDPSTWHDVEAELKSSGLTNAEVIYLITEINRTNIISEEHVNEARERFFSKQKEQSAK